MPANQATAIASDAGLTGPIRVDSGRSAPIRTPATTKMTSSASMHGHERADEEAQRLLARGDGVADHEHHRLHGDAADQVAGGEAEVALRRGGDGDRDLGQAAGDREQDDAAERLAEPEAPVDDVGRLRQRGAGDPDGDRAGREDESEQGCRQGSHPAKV